MHEQINRHMRDVLNHLYDFAYLNSHPLAERYWPEVPPGSPGRGHRLHRLVLETIGSLLPLDGSAPDSSRARWHTLLTSRYVEEWPVARVMKEMGCSRRQFYREQQEAIAMLCAAFVERHPPPSASAAESPDPVVAEATRVLGQPEVVQVTEVVRGVLPVANHLAEARGVALDMAINPSLPAVSGNRTLLRQVLLKSLSALITRSGTRKVSLDLRSEEGMVVVIVRCERGVGEEVGDREIVDLSPVRQLVKVLGGKWHSAEADAQGSTFHFGLPIAATGNRVLLVVEDNEGVIQAFRRYLAGYDYKVVGATSGEEARELARQLEPAVITLDVMMPSEDGWETLQTLKRDPRTSDIPVIVCSVLVDPDLAQSLGASAYLQKPVTQEALISALARFAPRPA